MANSALNLTQKVNLIHASDTGRKQRERLHRLVCESLEKKMAGLVQIKNHTLSEASKAKVDSAMQSLVVKAITDRIKAVLYPKFFAKSRLCTV